MIVLIILVILALIPYLLQKPTVQNYVKDYATSYLSERWDKEVHLSNIWIDYPRSIELDSLYIADEASDTLLWLEYMKGDILELSYSLKKAHFSSVQLNGLNINGVRKPDASLNLDAILSDILPDETVSEDSLDTGSADWDISFQHIQSRDVDIEFIDERNESNYFLSYEQLDINANEIDINQQVIDLSSIKSKDLEVNLVLSEDTEYTDENASFILFPLAWDLKVNEIDIEDADISYAKRNIVSDAYSGGIDWNDIHVLDLDLMLLNVSAGEESLVAEIDKMDFIEKGGLEVRQTQAQLKMTDKKMELTDLLLRSKASEIKDAVTFKYKSLSDFSDFVEKVRMDINLVDSRIIYDDLAYFAPGLNDLSLKQIQKDETVKISGRLKGKTNSLGGKDLKISLADGTQIAGSFSSQELTDPENTFLDFKLEAFKTTARSLKRLLPGVNLPSSFIKLGTMDFSGRYTGFYSDFVAYGTLNTALGEVRSDIKLTIDGEAEYSGELNLKDFDIGAYLEQEEEIGLLTFDAKVNGRGLKLDDIEATMDGNIESFRYRGYEYTDVKLDGIFQGRQFTGDFNIEDDNIAMDFQGKFDMSGDIPSYNFSTDLRHLDLNKLNILPDNYQISTKGSANMSGDDIDNFVGTAFFEDIVLTYEGEDYALDALDFESQIVNGEKVIDLKSEIAEAHFKGQFSFRDIYYAVQNVVNEYISYRFLSTSKLTDGQYIDFNIEIRDPLTLTESLVPGLEELTEGSITGSVNSITNELMLDMDIPSMRYLGYQINGLEFNAYTENNQLLVDAILEDINTPDSIKVEDIDLIGRIENDELIFELTAAQDSARNSIYLDGIATVDADTINLSINDSDIKIGEEEWAATSGEIRFVDEDYLLVNELVLEKDSQRFEFDNKPLSNGKSIAHLKADAIQIQDFLAFIGDDIPDIRGELNGDMEINDLLNLPQLTGDFIVSDFAIGDEVLGDLNFIGLKKPNTDAVYVDGTLDGEDYRVQVEGDVAYAGTEVDMDLKATASRFDLKVLEEILDEFIYDTEGNATADLTIKGDFKNPIIDGTIRLEEGMTTVGYLKTTYASKAQDIAVRNRKLIFNRFILTDSEDNRAVLNGDLSFKDLDAPEIYLDINTDRFLFLNTDEPDNESFYGTVYGSGDLNFSGPFDKLEVIILAQSEKGTVINLPLEESGSLEEESFFTFINVETDSLAEKEKKYEIDLSSWLMTFNMNVTPDAEMNIIFDKAAGDIISATGDGNLRMEVNKFGDLNIFGDYNIVEGDYLFTMQNLINKKFIIEPGSRISWSGDPYLARLDVNAQYEKNLSPYDLISDQSESLSDSDMTLAKKRQPSRVNLKMDGILDNPDISMKLDVDEVEGGLVDLRIQNRLTEINNDPEKLNEQVFAVLILNQFVPYSNSASPFSSNSDLLVSSANTLSEFVSNQLSIYLTDAVSEVIPDIDINLNYQIYDTEDNVGSYRTNELELALGKRLLNDRLYVTLGGNLQLEKGGSTDATVSNQVLAGDFLIEYNITPDGTLKVKAYNQSDYDIIAKRVNKSGIGLSLRRQYDRYSDLFRRR